MAGNREEWEDARNELAAALEGQGFPGEVADVLARDLGSPRAISRMASYIRQARPDSMEMIADEMISIREEIDAWKRKNDNLEANVKYNRVIRNGIDDR